MELMQRADYERRLEELKRRFPYQWEGDHLDLYIEPGWLTLFEEVCSEIDALLSQEEKKGFHWRQIKEKFGKLRAYFSGRETNLPEVTVKKITSIIDKAEEKSGEACLFCGAPGSFRNTCGWMHTACDEHFQRDRSLLPRFAGEQPRTLEKILRDHWHNS